MKKIYSFLIALLALFGQAQAQVTFDFSGENAYELFGMTGFSSNDASDGDFTDACSATSGDVTITVSPSEGKNPNRMWSGSLRMYGGTLTIASTGENITSIDFVLNSSKWGEANAADSGTLEKGKWTGSAATVVITIAANTQIKSMTVNFGGGDTPVDPVTPTDSVSIDWTSSAEAPMSVATVLERAAQLEVGKNSETDVFVKGKISNIKYAFDAQHGTATFSIADFIPDSTSTSGQAVNEFLCYGTLYLGNRNWAEGDDQIALGDEVIVKGIVTNYNGTLEMASKKNCLYSLNGKTDSGDVPVPEVTEYTKISDMQAAAQDLGSNKVAVKYSFTDAIVLGVKSKNIYLTDGQRGLLIYGTNTKELKAGDVVSGSISGELQLYNGVTELGNANFDEVSIVEKELVATPVIATIADVSNSATKLAYESMLVTIEDLTIVVDGTNVKGIDDSDNEIVLFDNYNIGLANLEFVEGNTYNVTAIVGNYKGTIQLYPRTIDDIDGEFVEPNPYEFVGDGSAEKPYIVEDVLSFSILAKTDTIQVGAWVEGYIVGTVKSNKLVVGVEEPAATNLAIASSADEQTVFLPVELPNNDVRQSLNLADNPDLLGKKVWLCGIITQYFGMNGLKAVSDFRFDSETGIQVQDATAAGKIIYNLAGQRVSNLTRSGLYIVNGKKVVVK